MKVLITGATGLVGKALVEALHRQKAAVNYLTTSKHKITSSQGYQGFYWNPKKSEIDLACFEGVTHIINLAGSTVSKRWTTSYKKEILNSRIDSLRTLRKGLEEFGEDDIDVFVSASAIGIYPHSLTTLYAEDEDAIDKGFLGQVVADWEKEIVTFKKFGFPVAQVRIGVVLSCNGGALPQMVKPIQNFVGAAFGSGEQWQSWIHLDDLAGIFIHILNEGLGGTFNGVAPNPVTNQKLTKCIASVLKRPLVLPNVPKFVMKAILGEMANLVFASQRVSSKKIQDTGFEFTHHNIGSALEDLLLDGQHMTNKCALTKEYA